MFTGLPESDDSFPTHELPLSLAIQVFEAEGLPPMQPGEIHDVFSRHERIPGHRQDLLENVKTVQIGGGGLGGWNGMQFVRSGSCKSLTIIEKDRFERSNGSRQLLYTQDIGEWKAFALAKNLLPHAMRPMRIIAIALPFERVLENRAQLEQMSQEPILDADILIVAVDNNACRFEGMRFARERRIPAVFTMLSTDSMRMHCFLQGPHPTDACLHCALPNLDPKEPAVYCAPANIQSCFRAAAQTVFFCHQALMGWPPDAKAYNWYEADFLSTSQPARTGFVRQRPNCPTCNQFR